MLAGLSFSSFVVNVATYFGAEVQDREEQKLSKLWLFP